MRNFYEQPEAKGLRNFYEETSSQNKDAQQPGVSPTPNDVSYSVLKSLFQGAGQEIKNAIPNFSAGLSKSVENMINLPSRASSAFLPKDLQALAPHVPEVERSEYARRLGVKNPNSIDEAIQDIGQYAPYQAFGELLGGPAIANALYGPTKFAAQTAAKNGLPFLPRALAQSGIGASYGATQSETPVKSAVTGAVAGPLIEGAFALPGAVAKVSHPFTSQFAAPGLAKTVSEEVEGARGATNEGAYQQAIQHLNEKVLPEEKSNWDSVNRAVDVVDTMGHPYSNRGFKEKISEEIARLKNESNKSSIAKQLNADAIKFYEDQLKDAPTDYKGAIFSNQKLNDAYDKEFTQEKSSLFKAVKNAKRILGENVDENIKEHGLEKSLGYIWAKANQSTAQKNKTFNQIVSAQGTETHSPFKKFRDIEERQSKMNEKAVKNELPEMEEISNKEDFILPYLPGSKGSKVGRMKQLSSMMGDEESAKNAIKMNYFQGTIDKNNLNVSPFLEKYSSLKPDEKNFLFNQKQQNQINAMQSILSRNPNALSVSKKADLINKIIAVGGAGLWAFGYHPYFGATAAAYPVLKYAAGKALGRPKSQARTIARELNSEEAVIPGKKLARITPSIVQPELSKKKKGK